MLFINHFATFVLASLVSGSTVLAMPMMTENPEIMPGTIYEAEAANLLPEVQGVVCVLPDI
jgi:hypothetical protein